MGSGVLEEPVAAVIRVGHGSGLDVKTAGSLRRWYQANNQTEYHNLENHVLIRGSVN